jgi:hypothetical protein
MLGKSYLFIAVPVVSTFGTAETISTEFDVKDLPKCKGRISFFTHTHVYMYVYLFIYLPVFMVCLRKFSVNLDKDITMSKKIGEEMNWQDI